MLVVPKFEGLDLPVHDPDTFVATHPDLRYRLEEVTQDYTAPRFVRAMMIQLNNLSHAPDSAAELLKKTEEELAKIAELCGAAVVGHEWGLYPVDGKGHDHRRYVPASQGLGGIITLPRNHILVAEVDVIKPASPAAERDDPRDPEMAASHAAITAGVHRYYDDGRGTYQLFDMRDGRRPRTEHFMLGTPVGSPDDSPARHLIDIEPRFRLTA